LKCCLNYELEVYTEKLNEFPSDSIKLKTESGLASLRKIDILKGTAWYCYENSFDWIPVDVDRVNEIIAENKKGKTPMTLSDTAKGAEIAFKTLEFKDDLLGDTDLTRMDDKNKGNRSKSKGGNRNKSGNRNPNNRKTNKPGDKDQKDQPGGQKPSGDRKDDKPRGERRRPNPNKKPNPNRANRGKNGPKPDDSAPTKDN
jgi:hypothetical protein